MCLTNFIAWKSRRDLFDDLLDCSSINKKKSGSTLGGKSNFNMMVSFSLLNCNVYHWNFIQEDWIRSKNFLSADVPLCVQEPFVEYCCSNWGGSFNSYLNMLNSLKKWLYRAVDHTLATSVNFFFFFFFFFFFQNITNLEVLLCCMLL